MTIRTPMSQRQNVDFLNTSFMSQIISLLLHIQEATVVCCTINSLISKVMKSNQSYMRRQYVQYLCSNFECVCVHSHTQALQMHTISCCKIPVLFYIASNSVTVVTFSCIVCFTKIYERHDKCLHIWGWIVQAVFALHSAPLHQNKSEFQ